MLKTLLVSNVSKTGVENTARGLPIEILGCRKTNYLGKTEAIMF